MPNPVPNHLSHLASLAALLVGLYKTPTFQQWLQASGPAAQDSCHPSGPGSSSGPGPSSQTSVAQRCGDQSLCPSGKNQNKKK